MSSFIQFMDSSTVTNSNLDYKGEGERKGPLLMASELARPPAFPLHLESVQPIPNC